jgi:hypothetical protein
VWLVAHLAAALTVRVGGWPVAAVTPFARDAHDVVVPRAYVSTVGGRRVEVMPEDLHFKLRIQRDWYLIDRVIKRDAHRLALAPGGRAAMATLARLWTARHPDDPARSITVTAEIFPLPAGTRSHLRHIATVILG